VANKCSQVKGGGLPNLFQADAEHGLQVVLRVDLEGDMGTGLHDARNLGKPGRDDLGDLLMIFHPEDRNKIKLAGDRVGLGDTWHVGQRRSEPGDRRPLGLDQHNRRHHDGILSSRWRIRNPCESNICSYNWRDGCSRDAQCRRGSECRRTRPRAAQPMTVEDCCAFLTTQGRDTVLATIVELLQLVHGMDKSGMVPDQHGNALMALGRVRDLSGLEMSEHAAELNKSEACMDWGSVSTQDWIRHQCHQPSGTAADLLHVGEQLANLPKTIAAVRDGSIGFAHAAIIARHAQAITHSDSAEPFDEAPFLRAARESSVSRLWYYSMHAWHRADPDGVADEQRQAAERRYLCLTDGDDGTLYVNREFDSAAGATIRT